MEKYIAVGDIHGCVEQLEELFSQIKKYPDHKIVFLGDYIDRGPESNEVINFIKNIPAIFLMGNHEAMYFDIVGLLAERDKIKDFFKKRKISYENYLWLISNARLFYETKDYIFSHAGLNTGKQLYEQHKDDFIWSRNQVDYSIVTNKIVIHGHSSVDKVEINENNINVDTGCGKNGYLSAIVLPEMKILQSNSKGLTSIVF